MLLSIGVGVLVLSMAIMASLVLIRSSAPGLDRSFAYFTLITAFWISVNYIGANFQSHPIARYFAHADFFSGSFVVLLLWLFTTKLLDQTNKTNTYVLSQANLRLPYFALASIAGIASFFPSFIRIAYIPYISPKTITNYGNYFIFYAFILFIIILTSLINIFTSLHLARGRLHQQISVMVTGLIAAICFVAAANLLLPILTSSQSVNLIAGNLAYIGIAAFILTTFYSIIKHRLFDLRLILAKSLAYTLLIGSFTVFYIGIAVVVSSFLIKGYDSSARQLLITIGLMIILITTVDSARKFFDKYTNRIFYRDSYDPQTFLDDLNKTLITNLDLKALLQHTSKIIEDNIKCEHVMFTLYGSNNLTRCIGSSEIKYDSENVKTLLEAFDSFGSRMLVYDTLEDQHNALKSILRKNNVAVFIRLESERINKEDVRHSYLSLGNKKSGNPYSKQDLRIIEIIANELVIAIQNALRFEEIQNFNITLQEQVNEATLKLRRTNERLRALDETKDDFISMASHQLRTPLTSIKGYVSLVLEGDAGKVNAAQKEMLQQAFFSSQRMVYLISDLLNVSRLKNGKFVINPSPVNLADMVQQELTQLQETAAARDLTLKYDKSANFPTLNLDETKTRQVIMNFVDNAIYYTPAGGQITVKLIDKPDTIELRVEDNGIGVPKSEQPHLFTKFYRAGNARKARPDGTGLGLFMAKKVIVAQGGSTIFESRDGKGSTFGFVFNKHKLKVGAKPLKPDKSITAE